MIKWFSSDKEEVVPILPEIYAATAEKEVVRLPGGCTVSHIQYKQLKDFMEAPSIDQW